jgi:crotonobetainyl-CoA:carnitine CoA-transferase CaiB-like acyl-CoA transferase
MPGPLEGLIVVDASWGLPAGICGLLLADYGAKVLKVERPSGGTPANARIRSVVDRNKWSLELDLDSPAGKDAFLGLLPGADVLIDSWGPRVARQRGLDPESLTVQFPQLVHCAVTGYSQSGPWRDRPAYESLLTAWTGMTGEQQGHREKPIFLGHPGVSYVTGFLATIGTLAALRARSATGRGQIVDASLLDGMLAINSMNWWWNEQDISYLARSGDTAGFGRNRILTDLYQCGDGEYLMVHSGGDGGFKRTMDILGIGEKVRAIDGLEMAVPLDDDEYDAARNKVPNAFRQRDRDEWIKLFHAADIAALPVLRPEEVFLDEQVKHAGLMVEVEDDQHGSLRQVGPVIKFTGSPAATPIRAPRPGEHADQLDDWPGRVASRAAQSPRDLAHPLDGIRILDFSAFFATGYGARLLSDLGADVIKVEPKHGDQMRPMPDLFEGANRGKRNLCVDLRTPEGQDVVRRLVATADVVMHNMRPGKAEKIGIGYQDVKALNPDVIYAYLPGFGSTGPKALLKSFAPLVSGFTGLLYEGAGAGNPPVRRVLGNEDLYNGYSGAVAVLMALYHRDRTGQGQYVENPQLHSSLFVVSEHTTTGTGEPLPAYQLDAQQTGMSATYRMYQTIDGWVSLVAWGDAAFSRLVASLDAQDLADDSRFASEADRLAHSGELSQLMEPRFAALSTEEAMRRLTNAGVAAEIALDYPLMPELLWDEWLLETQRIFELHHAEVGWVREVGLVVHLSDTPGLNKGTSAALGQHSGEILAELGYSAEQIEVLGRGSVLLAQTRIGAETE